MKQLSLGLTWTAQYALGVQYSEKTETMLLASKQ